MPETLEDRIRQRAYLIWEASGRPSGRDDEFWHRASEMIATAGHDQPSSEMRRRQPDKARPALEPRKRSRRTSQPASTRIPAPAR